MSRETPAARSEFNVWRKFTTRWADNDAYGHVNNTIFYQWFDSAVNGWLVGQGLLDIQAGDPIALVVETRCSYFASLEFPQDVEVGLAVGELGRSSVRYGGSGALPTSIASASSPKVQRRPRRRASSSTCWSTA